jgi:hypothetical protein
MDQTGNLSEFDICQLNMPSHLLEAAKKKPAKKKPEAETEQSKESE